MLTNEEIADYVKQEVKKILDLRAESIVLALSGKMQDITAPETVEIQVREDGKVIWVNVNGVCVLRCCQIKNLQVDDNRKG